MISSFFDRDVFSEKLASYFVRECSKFLFIKKHEWQYENEYRLISKKQSDGPLDIELKPEYLKEVIFGIKFPDKEKSKFVQIISGEFTKTKMYEAEKYNGDMRFKPI